MSLAPGTHLGPFEILAPIGAGGMGEVYRAKDTKLKREVALKVLPDSFAGDRDRMARFQREAEMLASLNHRNIAQIYGVEDRAIVMELVEGGTLSGPLPIETALNYARQIAEALEYAHERGVIHRDLKPANIKVTPDGTVKLLDFGLAKAIEDPTSSRDDPEHSPTLTLGVTRVGVILGTAAYMSPEQASGRTADRRADIWGFGAVLYEMLSGKRAFVGESVSDTLACVLKVEPDWTALPAETPAAIRRLIQRCLTKDRKQRLQAIGEARIAIDQSLSGAIPETTEPLPARRRIMPWVVAVAAVLAAGVAGWGWWRATRPVERPLVRLDVDLGSEVALTTYVGGNVILSPDGRRLVYCSGDPRRLYTRRMDQPKASELPGTEGAAFPFFSPDGQWVGFSTETKLNKISVEGGAVVPLADLPPSPGASWGTDGNILLGRAFSNGLTRISANGGALTPVLSLAPGELGYIFPQILPGGKAVLFVDHRKVALSTANIEVFTFADRQRKTLVRGAAYARYLPSGHLVYTNKGTLFAIPFDVDRLETRGTPVVLLDDVWYETIAGDVDLDFAQTGTLVFRRGGRGAAAEMRTIQWVDGAGKKEPLLAKPGAYSVGSGTNNLLRLSPDGKRIALVVKEGASQNVWVYNPQRDTMTKLTFGEEAYNSPIWSPDGQYVVFSAPGMGISRTRADGAGQPQPLTQSREFQAPCSFTPDGKRLAYLENPGKWQIWTLPLEDQGGQLKAGKPEQFLKSQFYDYGPMFSPDGHWLAYQSDESGAIEVYVRAYPPPVSGQGRKWQISNSGGGEPLWSRNGHELVYRKGDQLMSVSYSINGDSFVAEKPRVWITKLGGTSFDLAPDGKRVAVVTPVESKESPKPDHEVTFLFNFFDELRRRAPVGK
jgi:serine/threonine-protein kinase